MTNLQTIIDQANRKTRSTLNRQFAKRSSNEQLLDKITAASRNVLDHYHANNTAAFKLSLRELETLTTIAEKRAGK